VELYQQVAWKLDETKKYYSLYNTLDTTLTFIQKEVSSLPLPSPLPPPPPRLIALKVKLLNSIGDNFDEAMKSSQSTQEYLEQFRNIVKGVEVSHRGPQSSRYYRLTHSPPTQDSLKRQVSVASQREQRVEELKVTHQNVSASLSVLPYPLSLCVLAAGRRAAQVLQGREGFPGGVHEERVPGGEARAAEEAIVFTALSGAERGGVLRATSRDGIFLRPFGSSIPPPS
jgi:hypothetical protein